MLYTVRKIVQENLILVAFFFIVLFGGFFADNFFSLNNISNVLKQTIPLIIVSMGMLLVILTGGIDLSVGALVALASVIIAKLSVAYGLAVGVLAGIAIISIVGFISGVLITYGRLVPFIATLVLLSISRGVALILSDGSTVYVQNSDVLTAIAEGTFLGIPVLFYFCLAIIVIMYIIKSKTYLGRFWVAIGSNREAAYFTGINTKIYELIPYVFSAFLSGITAFIYLVRTGTGSPIAAQGFELDVIAAVVIGGASMYGGRGRILNTVIGALILGSISNLMNLMSIPGYHQQIVKGVLIAVAVLAANFESKRIRKG